MQYSIYYDNTYFLIIHFYKETILSISINHEKFCYLFSLQNFLRIKIEFLHCLAKFIASILLWFPQNYLTII